MRATDDPFSHFQGINQLLVALMWCESKPAVVQHAMHFITRLLCSRQRLHCDTEEVQVDRSFGKGQLRFPVHHTVGILAARGSGLLDLATRKLRLRHEPHNVAHNAPCSTAILVGQRLVP